MEQTQNPQDTPAQKTTTDVLNSMTPEQLDALEQMVLHEKENYPLTFAELTVLTRALELLGKDLTRRTLTTLAALVQEANAEESVGIIEFLRESLRITKALHTRFTNACGEFIQKGTERGYDMHGLADAIPAAIVEQSGMGG